MFIYYLYFWLQIIPNIKKRRGGEHGAGVLGNLKILFSQFKSILLNLHKKIF